MEHRWNTGRKYAADGQRMRAKINGNRVLFADDSRKIDGEFVINSLIVTSKVHEDHRLFQEIVMGRYDCSQYESTQASWEYLMVRGS